MKARERVLPAGVGNNGARGQLEIDTVKGKEAGAWEEPMSSGSNG